MAECIDRVTSYGTLTASVTATATSTDASVKRNSNGSNTVGNNEDSNNNNGNHSNSNHNSGEYQGKLDLSRRIICRYGRGCTHMNDVLHREQFWHPPISKINEELRRTHYICNECGFASLSLQELQLHLKRKTAWSNSSLVGCRISCLIDNKEWHEGFVVQFHRSGKHFVEFRMIGEKRWLTMKKMAFYIVERPTSHNSSSSNNSGGEFKESEQCEKSDGLAPLEDNWVYVEDVSLEYVFAQSILLKVYGSFVQETGHKTRGHTCLTEHDRATEQQMKGSLLYGELLPRGVNKALGPKKLNAQDALTLYDMGMGTGKVAIQAFMQFKNLKYVFGVELSNGRYSLAEEAVLRLVDLMGPHLYDVELKHGHFIQVVEKLADGDRRVLRLECGDMFDTPNIHLADIIMLETDVPNHLQSNLCHLLSQMHEGARALTYLDLKKIWSHGAFTFKQMESNKNVSDRFPTSWSVQRGHHFFLWTQELKDLKLANSMNSPRVIHASSFSSSSDSNHSSTLVAPNAIGCFPFDIRKIFSFRQKSHLSSARSSLPLDEVVSNSSPSLP